MKETSRHPGSVRIVVLRASIREILSAWRWLSVTQRASSDRDREMEARGGEAPRHGLRGCAPRAPPCWVSDKTPAPPNGSTSERCKHSPAEASRPWGCRRGAHTLERQR